MKIDPTVVIRDKLDNFASSVSNVSSKKVKLIDFSYFVGGSTVLHSLSEALTGKKLEWSPKDLDIYLSTSLARYAEVLQFFKGNKKYTVFERDGYEENQYVESASIDAYILNEQINLIRDARHDSIGRGAMKDMIFKNTDIATLCNIFDPFENKIYSTELAKEAVLNKELIMNPFFIERFTKFEENIDYDHTSTNISSLQYQNLCHAARSTILRVRKYSKERNFKVTNNTIEELKILKRFAENAK